MRGAHPTATTVPACGLRRKSHGNKSVRALQTAPQRLGCVWPLSRGRGPSSDEAGLHTTGLLQAGSALLEPLGCERRQRAEPATLAPLQSPASSQHLHRGAGEKRQVQENRPEPGFWCWGKSRSAGSARNSLLRELSAQREFNSVTDFSYM